VDYGGIDLRKIVVFSDFYYVLSWKIVIVRAGGYFFGERRFPTTVTTIFNN